jgi:glucose-6-phosphate isomerase
MKGSFHFKYFHGSYLYIKVYFIAGAARRHIMDREIVFGDITRSPDIRMLKDMEAVIYDREWLENAGDMELYYMYRELYFTEEDRRVMESRDLRYDMTVIPAGMLGREYVKTAGHFHPHVPGTTVSYAEAYQVLEGEATYFLQKGEGGDVTDVVVLRASAGDAVVVPPGYGHITINASATELKMANWVCRSFSSDYTPIQKKHGGAYYLVREGFIKNPSYDAVPGIRHVKPRDVPEFGLYCGEDMYDLVQGPDRLDFLTRPQDFRPVFDRLFS